MNKHDVNIKKGKLINFQIGIIALISFCYIMHEVSHYVPSKQKDIARIVKDEFIEEAMGPVLVWEAPSTVTKTTPIEEPQTKPKEVKIEPAAEPEVVDNKIDIKPTEEKPTPAEAKTNTPTTTTSAPSKTSGDSKVTKKATPTVLHNRKTVDIMPVFPGCNKYSTNNELAACFQEKIQRMINKRFDRSIGDELGLSGLQHISLYFEINEQGQVSNIRARSKYPEFIEEAKRVVSLLPTMKPAFRNGKKVKMAYNQPIIFQVMN